jgi:hypothetical protein
MRERRQAIFFTIGRPPLDENVFSFQIPKVAQTLAERFFSGCNSGKRSRGEEPYPGNFSRLLCFGRGTKGKENSAKSGARCY